MPKLMIIMDDSSSMNPERKSAKNKSSKWNLTASKHTHAKDRKSVQGHAVISDLSERDEHLFIAISFGKIHRVLAALSHVENINVKNHEQQTLLICATHTMTGQKCNHLVRELLAAGSDVNAQDIYGRTALMYACADSNNDDSVRHIIRRPTCDPNLTDFEGNTALMFAVAAEAFHAVEILTKHRKTRDRININITNNANLTALDMAVALKSVKCCKIILDSLGHKITEIADEHGLSVLIKRSKRAAESSV